MMKTKRERSCNFNKDEVRELLSLVEKRKDILENKKSDSETWRQKVIAWDAVALELNSKFNTDRCSKSFKQKYDGLKRDTRRRLASQHNNGVGNSDSEPLMEEHIRVKEIMLLSEDGREASQDSDQVETDHSYAVNGMEGHLSELQPQPPSPSMEKRPVSISSDIEDVTCMLDPEDLIPSPDDPGNDPNATPAVSKRRLESVGLNKRIIERNQAMASFAEAKRSLVELQKKALEQEMEERTLRMQLLRKEAVLYDLKIEMLKLEVEEKKRRLN